MIQATACASVFVRAIEEHVLRAQYCFCTRLTPGAVVKWSVRLKRLPFDVVVKTFCNFLSREKVTEAAVVNGAANPSPTPVLIALNIFNMLN